MQPEEDSTPDAPTTFTEWLTDGKGTPIECGSVRRVTGGLGVDARKKLMQLIEEPGLPEEEKKALYELLTSHHQAFSLDQGERGETD